MTATATRSFLASLFFLALSLLFAGPALAQQPERIGGNLVKTGPYKGRQIEYVARQIAVKRAPSASQTRAAEVAQPHNAAVLDGFDDLGWGQIELPKGQNIFPVISALESSPLIEVAEPNMVMRIHLAENRSATAASSNEPGDPFYSDGSQWALKNTGQSPPGGTADADIDAERAWNGTTGSSDVVIAVLDTGIPMDGDGDWDQDDLSHPDLDDQNKIIVGPDYTGDGNGVTDEVGHGTHVAGIAGAETNNGTGVAGVCWNCHLMPIQVFKAGGGMSSWFYKGVKHAVDYAENNGLDLVINYSGGGPAPSSQLEDAVEYASDHHVPIVTSGGNAGGDEEKCAVEYPAAYSDQYSNVIAVAATDPNDDWASYSCKGPELNVAAPGGAGSPFDEDDIFSTVPTYPVVLSQQRGQSYRYLAGTSQASPHVAGTAGLMLSVEPSLTASDIRGTLEANSEDLGASGFDEKFGHGRINAFWAVEALFPPVDVTLSGPTSLDSGETGTWTASVSGGAGSPSYLWEANPTYASGWGSISCSGPSCSRSFVNTCNEPRTAGIRAIVTKGTQTDTGSQMVSIAPYAGNAPPCSSAPWSAEGPVPEGGSLAVRGLQAEGQNGGSAVRLSAGAPAPQAFALEESYPNPVQAGQPVTIAFALPEAAEVTLEVYDVLGRPVRRIESGTVRAGHPRAVLGTEGLASGVYVYRLTAGGTSGEPFSGTGKLIVVK